MKNLKKPLANLRGIELGINIVIILAIGVLVLFIVLGFFTGWFSQLSGGIQAVSGELPNQTGAIGKKIGNISSLWQ